MKTIGLHHGRFCFPKWLWDTGTCFFFCFFWYFEITIYWKTILQGFLAAGTEPVRSFTVCSLQWPIMQRYKWFFCSLTWRLSMHRESLTDETDHFGPHLLVFSSFSEFYFTRSRMAIICKYVQIPDIPSCFLFFSSSANRLQLEDLLLSLCMPQECLLDFLYRWFDAFPHKRFA